MRKLLLILLALLLLCSPVYAGASLDFDGVDDVGETNTAVTTPSSLTMSADIFADNAGEGGFGRIVIFDNTGTGAAPTTGLSVEATSCSGSDLRLGFRADYSTTDPTWIAPCGSVTSGSWYHIAATYDGGNLSTSAALYVNGVSQSLTFAGGSGAFVTASDEIFVGNVDNGTRTWDGRLAYIQVFNAILSQQQISQLTFNPSSDPTSLFRYWSMLNAGSTEPDLSGNAESLAITGATDNATGPPVMLTAGMTQ